MLFTPADRPDMLEKAAKLDADSLIMDLEDAVAFDKKEKARAQVEEALKELNFEGKERVVRINSLETKYGFRDLEAIRDFDSPPDAIMIPKVESAGEVRVVERWLAEGVKIIPLIETAQGVLAVEEIAKGSQRIVALMFGGGDLTLDIGGEITSQTLLFPRSKIVLAASAVGVDVVDYPFLNIRDIEGLEADAKTAAKLGFDGKAVIHPNQIPIVNRIFTPSEEEIERARKILKAYEDSGGRVTVVDGEMVDWMTVRKAKRIIKIAEKVCLT